MSSVRYTAEQKAAAAFRVLAKGETKARVAEDVGTTRKSLANWCKSAAVLRMVRQMTANRPGSGDVDTPATQDIPASNPTPGATLFDGAEIIDDIARRNLRAAILKPMPLSLALAQCRLSVDAPDRWRELADTGHRGAVELLADVLQWSASAVSDLTDIILQGGSAGKGAQWLLSKLHRDIYGEAIVAPAMRNALEAYSDADLEAIAARGAG